MQYDSKIMIHNVRRPRRTSDNATQAVDQERHCGLTRTDLFDPHVDTVSAPIPCEKPPEEPDTVTLKSYTFRSEYDFFLMYIDTQLPI